MKKFVIIILCTILCASCLVGCQKNETLPDFTTEPTQISTEATTESVETTQNAEETFQKIFPYYNENLGFGICYREEATEKFTEEEIKELTWKAEKYDAVVNNTGAEDYQPEYIDFYYNRTGEELLEHAKENNNGLIITSYQAVYITKINNEKAEVCVVVTYISGTDHKEYLEIGYTGFIKENEVWLCAGANTDFRGLNSEYMVYKVDNDHVYYDKIG